MSFSQQVKNELLKIEYENSCCERALFYGLCIFGKSFSGFEVVFQTENERIAKLYKKLLEKYCNVRCNIKVSPKGKNYSIIITNKAQCAKILGTYGHNTVDSIKINFSNFDCDNCVNAFLAGAFLACGTISSPQKDYHLEFTIAYSNLSKSFATLMGEMDMSPKLSNRKGYNIIYFKESEAIEDCLYHMGAASSMFELMNVKIIKDIRNKANRTANCETANIEKTVSASIKQIDAIEKIKKSKGLDYLKSDLKDIALLRCDNPEASLTELAQLSGLSRSGVNHRLSRIIQISEDL